ncbi:MAG: efflux RND transporter periplasmic adaptor subunit [Nitrobacter sp.]
MTDPVKLLAYRVLDLGKGGSVSPRTGRAWIESRHLRAPAGSPKGGQFQSAPTADQTAAGWVSTHWRIPAAAVALVILAFGAGGGWLYWSAHRSPPVHYATQKIELGSIVRTVTASGVVVPVASTQVGSRVSGVIEALYCAANTNVKAGQLCAKLDPHPYQIAVEQDKADLAAAKDRLEKDNGDLARAKVAFEHHEVLAKRRATSRQALDKSRSAYEELQTQTKGDELIVSELSEKLMKSEADLGYTSIVAPIDGTVISRNAAIGQTVVADAQAPTLFLIATDLSTIHIDADVDNNSIDEIKLGNKVTFTVKSVPDHSFTGKVIEISQSPQVLENIAAYDVVISADNPDQLLDPGITAAIAIVVDRRDDVLRVPDQALRYSPVIAAKASTGGTGAVKHATGSAQVFILHDGMPTVVPVELGPGDGAYTEITGGDLKPGDDLIVDESNSQVNQ